jgi:hypothetical protein
LRLRERYGKIAIFEEKKFFQLYIFGHQNPGSGSVSGSVSGLIFSLKWWIRI